MAVKKQKKPKSKSTPEAKAISLTKKELRIRYENSHDLMNKLFQVTQHVANLHASESLISGAATQGKVLARFSPADVPNVLGPVNAGAIVSSCAGSHDGNTALGDIPGLDLRIFQNCVQQGVIGAGFKPGAIPASSSTKLDTVIQAIAGSVSN